MEKINNLLNIQLNAELFSSYLYLAMSAYLESQTLKGMAKWMRVQSEEEKKHSDKLYNYLIERGIKVEFSPIAAPVVDGKSALNIFEAALAHEKKITSMIYKIVELSLSEKDYATNNFIQWYVAEQVEEESSTQAIVDQLKLVGEAKGGLMVIDHHLGKRQ